MPVPLRAWHFCFIDPATMTREECFKAGFIMRPHGLKGEVTISLDADSPADWNDLDVVFVELNHSLVPYFIETVSVRGDKAFLKLEDVGNAEQAGLLKNHSLYLPRASRPKPVAGDFYDDEVIGYEVFDLNALLIGKVKTIERAGINRFLIVNYQDKEVMIPAQKPLLKSINRSKKTITVNLPDGFLEI